VITKLQILWEGDFFILQEFQVETLGFEHLNEMYQEDSNFKEAYEACENPLLREKNQWMEYLIQDILLFKETRLCILKFSTRDNFLKEKHSGGLVGHFGHDKTHVQLSYSYYWYRMKYDMKNFVGICRIYQYSKGKYQNARLYQPLPVLDRSWDAISMDFVLGFPRTRSGSDSISVVVDRFFKMEHLIPFHKTSDATHIEKCFFNKIVRLHGFPRSIVSKRDTKLMGHFWRNLWKKMGKILSFSSTLGMILRMEIYFKM
jgi:hypothetical protein